MTMISPCESCITLAVCKQKEVIKCSILSNWVCKKNITYSMYDIRFAVRKVLDHWVYGGGYLVKCR